MSKKSKRRKLRQRNFSGNSGKKPSEAPRAADTPPIDPSCQNHVNAQYDKTEAYLRRSCRENHIPVPDVFENWRIHFFSRGSALREWGRCLNHWLQDQKCKPVTDMTPNHILEKKIKERRETNGGVGPQFRTIEEKVANLKGVMTHGWKGPQATSRPTGHKSPWKPWVPEKKKPTIPAPSGMDGENHLVI
jgi:hypothetical protein